MARPHIKLRTEHNYDRDAASDASGIDASADNPELQNEAESTPRRAQQQFKEECDINTIVRRFGLTGQLPTTFRTPMSGDFTGLNDFHTAMQQVREAEENFMRLPAELRKRFNNDPHEMHAFVLDANNKDEATKLGLMRPPRELARDGSELPLRVVVESTPPQPDGSQEPQK